MKNLQDIITGRVIWIMGKQEFAGIQYECWEVEPPLFSDQVEKLLEEGYMVSMLSAGVITVNKEIPPTPERLRENKEFWNDVGRLLKG